MRIVSSKHSSCVSRSQPISKWAKNQGGILGILLTTEFPEVVNIYPAPHDAVIKWKTFYALLAICAGNSPVIGEFPSQRAVTRNFDLFFDLSINEGLSKQTQGWWFVTPSRPLWRQSNEKRFKPNKDIVCEKTINCWHYYTDWIIAKDSTFICTFCLFLSIKPTI